MIFQKNLILIKLFQLLAWFTLKNTSKVCKDFRKASSLGDSYADKIMEKYFM